MISYIFRNSLLRKKVLITLVGIAIYRIGFHIPLPGVDHRPLYEYFTTPSSIIATYNFFAGGALSRATVFSLGIAPYFTGSVLTLLMSGIIPYLKRLRDGTVDANKKFDRFIYCTTAAIALLQSWGIAIFLESLIPPSGQPIVSDIGWGFRLKIMLTMTSGTMLLVWMADQITRNGITNGVALIFLIDLISWLPRALIEELQALIVGNQMILNDVLALAIFAGVTGASVFMLNAKRNIPLEFVNQNLNSTNNRNEASNIVLRLNTVGIIPVTAAQAVLFPVSYVFSLESLRYWIFYCGLIIFLAYLWTAITFSAKNLIKSIKQYGFAMSNMDSEKESTNYINRILRRIIFPYAVFLALMALTPFFIVKWLGINSQLAYFFGPHLLVISAVCITSIENMRLERKKQDLLKDNNRHDSVEWIPIFAGETELEVNMVREILQQAGIESVKYSNRVISALGTFAIWEATCPTLPSLAIHRRLGRGHVVAQVHSDQADEAKRVLTSHRIVSK